MEMEGEVSRGPVWGVLPSPARHYGIGLSPYGQTNKLKTLPSCTLRMWAVKM